MNGIILSQFEAIANGLADKGMAMVDNFLSAHEVHLITTDDDFKNGLTQFHKAGIGQAQAKQIDERIRGDYIEWIDAATASLATQTYLQRLNRMMTYLNQSLFLSLKAVEIHRTIYPIGSFYKRHLDQFKKNDHRKLSVICYLNDHWSTQEGGQLRIYSARGSTDICPIAGRLVCFRSDLLEHEVLPATRARLSLTGWMVDEEISLRR